MSGASSDIDGLDRLGEPLTPGAAQSTARAWLTGTREPTGERAEYFKAGRTRDAMIRYLITGRTPPRNTVYED